MLEETQRDLEYKYAKNQTLKRIKQYFIDLGLDKAILKTGFPSVEFGLDLVVQMVLHKRAKPQVLVGILHWHCDTMQQCADWLVEAANLDIVDWHDAYGVFIIRPNLDIPLSVQKEIDQFSFPLPMVVPPKEITNNRTTGYLTIPGSVILRDNHHDDDVVLEHLNAMNQIPLSLNEKVVSTIRNQWRNLDKQKEDETFQDYQKRLKAFEKYDTTSRDIIDGLFMLGNEIYLTHKYDKRGRTYCQGYHVSYQSNDWCKAVIEFQNQEVCQ